MTAKTHIAIGVGTSVAVIGSNDIKTILLGTGIAVVGALFPDIDIKESEGGKISTVVVGIGILVILLNIVLKKSFDIEMIKDTKTLSLIAISILLFILGKISSHRSFTHSLLGLVIYSSLAETYVGGLVEWFAIAYISHILIDILNKKSVKLLYPFNIGFKLGLCKSDGKVNDILFYVFIIIGIIGLVSGFIK